MISWLAQNAVTATILAGIVWALCRSRRFSPAVRHALWLLVLLKLVAPPIVTWPWPVPISIRWSRPPQIEAAVTRSVGDDLPSGLTGVTQVDPDIVIVAYLNDAAVTESDWIEVEERVGAAEFADASSELPLQHATLQPVPRVISKTPDAEIVRLADRASALSTAQVTRLVFGCWLLGTVTCVVIHGVRIFRFTRTISRFELAPPSLMQQVERIAARLGVRAPRVTVVDGLRSPVIWGSPRPRLIWPACLVEDVSSGRWDGVIAHELAHLRRRDHWIGWLELVSASFCWWNPLFWYTRHQLRENAELACDALVVWALPDGRRAYAESLIHVVSLSSRTATPVPVLGINSVARQAFERRLTMILCERVPWKFSLRGLCAVGVLSLAALPGWSQVPTLPAESQPRVRGEAAATVPAIESVPAISESQVIVLDNQPSALEAVVAVPAEFPDSRAAGNEDDARLDALEKKLDAIIAEVKAMRGSSTATRVPAVSNKPTLQLQYPATFAPQRTLYGQISTTRPTLLNATVRDENVQVQMLSRGTYSLPKAKAEALAAFLREHMKDIVEAEVKDDDGKSSLVVTTSAEAQTIVGQFIALSEGKVKTGGAASYQLIPQISAPRNP